MFGASPYIYDSTHSEIEKVMNRKDSKVFDIDDFCQYVEEAD